jgi:hypothetical protein
MNIKEQKDNFLDLLRSEYKAKQSRWKEKGHEAILDGSYFANSLDDFEKENLLKISDDILKKYGFDGSDFWEIICPSLKEDGYIKDFGDPNNIPHGYYEKNDMYTELKMKLNNLNEKLPYNYLLAKSTGLIKGDDITKYSEVYNCDIESIEREIEEIQKAYDYFIGFLRNSYPFFIVNKDRLKINLQKDAEVENKEISFIDGILYFNSKKIDFNKKPLQKDLLNTIFKNPNKYWDYDEIWEDWKEVDFKKEHKRKLYNTADSINREVAKKTTIIDFLDKNMKQVRIKPTYFD